MDVKSCQSEVAKRFPSKGQAGKIKRINMKKIDNTNPYIVTIMGIVSLGLLYLGTTCILNVIDRSLLSAMFGIAGTLIIPVGATLFAVAIISAFRIVKRNIIKKV
jgi:hypothetical protein